MDADHQTQSPSEDMPREGTFKRVILAPGRAAVAFHNAISPRGRKLIKGHWTYTFTAWMLTFILWLAILGMAAAIVLTVLHRTGK